MKHLVALKRIFLSAALVATATAASAPQVAAQTPQAYQYAFTKIAYPGATYTEASSINDFGQVVGMYTDSTGTAHGFTYENGVYTTLDYPGMVHNYAFGINNEGQIVGSYSAVNAPGPYHAWLKEADTFTEFDFPGQETDGRAINGFGHIVGIYNAGFGTPDHGFLKIGNTYTTVDYPGSTFTYLFGINDAGSITGTYRDAVGLLRGFMYSGGIYSSINYPGATETYVGGVNNSNAVVGWNVQSGRTNGFMFSGGSYRPVIVTLPGAINTRPRGLNDLGTIVGTYISPDCPIGCSFIATPTVGPLPMCNQTLSMNYAPSVLQTNFTLTTTVPTTWTTWLFVQNAPYRLWSIPIPPLTSSWSGGATIPLPPVGNVVLVSLLSTPLQGTICADFISKNTGS